MRLAVCSFCLYIGMLFFSTLALADKTPASAETAAEKLRRTLDRLCDVEINEQALDSAVNQLRQQTGLNLTIDRPALTTQRSNASVWESLGGPSPVYAQLRIGGRFHRVPLRKALAKMLGKHNLTHVLVGDTVLITTADKAVERQLGQNVSINLKDAALSDALRGLARETGANLILDPRSAKEGKTTLTLRLDEVPLASAVEVLADEAGLRALHLGNVLYVTSPARARKLRKPKKSIAAPMQGWHIRPDGKGGFRVTPLKEKASGDGIDG